ncbi:uncharacterized protein [Haliotis cracherodii]|uniref:uncharacterized protein n=1 Tax=Haliotis cracherodii TaxID=6455 RepID=UPI0039ED75F1
MEKSRIAVVVVMLLCLAASEEVPPKVAVLEEGHRSVISPHTLPVTTYTDPGAPVEKSPPPFAAPPPPHIYNKAVTTNGSVDHVVAADDVGSPTINAPDQVAVPAAPVSVPAVSVSAPALAVSAPQHDSRTPEAQPPVKAHSDPPKAERQYSNTGNSLSFSSSAGDGPGKRQCSFSVSTPDNFHASSDGFGYPTFMVEGAFNDNQLAKGIFTKYLGHPNTGLNLPGVSAAAREIGIPGFGGNHVDGLSSLGDRGQGNHGEPHGFDVNGMFNQIGKSVDNSNIGDFQHATPQFPDNVIQPGRGFGFNPLRSNIQSRDPFSNFGGLPFRRRREAIPSGLGGNEVQSVCPFTSDYIRSFKKYNTVCFVYKPEMQGHKVAKCGQEQCSHCGTGAGKCVAEQMSGWLWAYCQAGPSARKLSLEYIEYPAYCVCKTITC